MPDVIGIDHVYLAVSDLARAQDFYDRVLLQALGYRRNEFVLGGDAHVQYYNRHHGIVLRPARSATPHDPYAAGLHHLCLRVDSAADVEAAALRLRALGIAASEAHRHPEYAPDYVATFLRDPDGIRLEITNYRAERRERHDRWDALATAASSPPESHAQDWSSVAVASLRADLALALRAAAHHGLAEGVCNHFSVELPDRSGRFLLNPRGLLWAEVQADDIVLVDADGAVLAGRHPVEPTAMFIHAAVHRIAGHAVVLHTHMPHATALTLTADRGLDPALSQNAMRFADRIAIDAHYNGLALDASEGERIARAMAGKDVAFLGNHGVVVCGARIDHAYDDLYYLERACMVQVLAQSTGRPLVPVEAALARRVGEQTRGERLQSELFFAALRRRL